jgi:hypothetical protein
VIDLAGYQEVKIPTLPHRTRQGWGTQCGRGVQTVQG